MAEPDGLIARLTAAAEAHRRQKQEQEDRENALLAPLGLTIRRSEMEYGAQHVRLLSGKDTMYHWYPSNGKLYKGSGADVRIEGQYHSLSEVILAIEKDCR